MHRPGDADIADADGAGMGHGAVAEAETHLLVDFEKDLLEQRRTVARQEDGEFVPTDTGNETAVILEGLKLLGDLAQQPVSGIVPGRVVDRLERVDVEQSQTDIACATLAQGFAQGMGEVQAVGNLGQEVRIDGMLELLAAGFQVVFCLFARRDVKADGHIARDLSAFRNMGNDRGVDPVKGAVAPAVADLAVPDMA